MPWSFALNLVQHMSSVVNVNECHKTCLALDLISKIQSNDSMAAYVCDQQVCLAQVFWCLFSFHFSGHRLLLPPDFVQLLLDLYEDEVTWLHAGIVKPDPDFSAQSGILSFFGVSISLIMTAFNKTNKKCINERYDTINILFEGTCLESDPQLETSLLLNSCVCMNVLLFLERFKEMGVSLVCWEWDTLGRTSLDFPGIDAILDIAFFNRAQTWDTQSMNLKVVLQEVMTWNKCTQKRWVYKIYLHLCFAIHSNSVTHMCNPHPFVQTHVVLKCYPRQHWSHYFFSSSFALKASTILILVSDRLFTLQVIVHCEVNAKMKLVSFVRPKSFDWRQLHRVKSLNIMGTRASKFARFFSMLC